MLNVRKTFIKQHYVRAYSQIATRGAVIFGLGDWLSDSDCSLVCRDFSTRPRSRTHCYDILDLTPNASQSQVKAAFYKKSKIYHPDADKSGSGLAKFKEISEAYEILSNSDSRRVYDEGIWHRQANRNEYHHPDSDFQSDTHFHHQRGFEARRSPPTGRTKTYNFDEFYRQHYGDMLERERQQASYKKEMYERMHQQDQQEGAMRAMWMVMLILTAIAIAITK